MDFIDYESIVGDQDLPQPQPALSLPNMEDLGKRFTNLNSLTRSLLKREQTLNTSTKESELAAKYANMSLSMLQEHDINGENTDNELIRSQIPAGSKPDDRSTNNSAYLSVRLLRVLSSPLSDGQIRTIFGTLEQKIQNVGHLVEPGTTGSMARKTLRLQIEADLLKSQAAALNEYSSAYKCLVAIESRLNLLNELHTQILADVNDKLDVLLEFSDTIANLSKQRDELALKKKLLNTFKNKFTLNEYEEHCIIEGEINQDFFSALKRAELIHELCLVLLSLDNPQLGLKIMSKMNDLIQRGLDRTTTFCAKTLSNLYLLSTKEMLDSLHRSLTYLASKPLYLNLTLSRYTESRSKTIVDELLSQMSTDFEKNDLYSNLALSAHDPVRFVGDLLAYIHSVAVNEKENISMMFQGIQSGRENILNNILKTLCKPLYARIDQLIVSEPNNRLNTVDGIRKVLVLYSMMFKKQEITAFVSTLDLLQKAAVDKIENSLKNNLVTIKNSNQAQLDINVDLQPPEWISEFYSSILPLLEDFSENTILGTSKEVSDEFAELLVEEPLQIFNEHLSKLSLFNTRDQLILHANFYDLILSKITPITVLNDKVLLLTQREQETTQKLTEYQLQELYNKCGFTEYITLVNMISPLDDEFFDVLIYQPIVENKLFTEENLAQIAGKCQEFLPTALLDVQQALMRVNSPVVANEILTELLLQFARFWGYFRQIVNEYIGNLFVWSEYEIATLLGVENAYEERVGSSN